MHLRNMNWMDVEQYLEEDSRIMLLVGATEQHGYLSLLSDSLIPEKIADFAAERTGVLVAPPLNFGAGDLFASYPGTIYLSPTTFDAVVVDMVTSLMMQGFDRFFVINGHRANRLPRALKDMHMRREIKVRWFDWWCSRAVSLFEEQHGLRFDHANWGEGFPFNRVAPLPDGAKTPVNMGYIESGEPVRDVVGDGSLGGTYGIEKTLMVQLLFNLVKDAIRQLELLAD